jgi:Flp pilus assembly protein TadG
LRRLFQRWIKNQVGATAVEFAIVASAFFMLLLGVLEYGLIQFTKVQVESAVAQASRDVGIGKVVSGCPDRVCTVQKLIQDKLQNVIDPQSVRVTAEVVNSPTAAAPAVPDMCLVSVAVPYPPICTGAFVDNNSNGSYDPPPALTATSLGAPGDMVQVRATYLWRVIFPMFRSYFGTNGVLTITSATVVKNEPFD